jgi:hypothetical protein
MDFERANPIFKLQENSPKFWTLTFDLPGEKVNKLGKAVLHDFPERIAKRGVVNQSRTGGDHPEINL